MQQPEILKMGLRPIGETSWIETDDSWSDYHRNKLALRPVLDDKVYRADEHSTAAQVELAEMLLDHLTNDGSAVFERKKDALRYLPEDIELPLSSAEALWNCSLWVADDLVIMSPGEHGYCLSAASLCTPTHWRLEDKFGKPMADIHRSIPDFDRKLTPSIDRFFKHLKEEHVVVRFNWTLQSGNTLCCRPGAEPSPNEHTKLFYRCERQTLRRLPKSGSIVFTIRVYVHPLEQLSEHPGALPALFAVIDGTDPAIASYKNFATFEKPLRRYRAMCAG
ncbi:MAG: DUF3445 domain-containing protein [Pseudomonadota bacterium]